MDTKELKRQVIAHDCANTLEPFKIDTKTLSRLLQAHREAVSTLRQIHAFTKDLDHPIACQVAKWAKQSS